MILSFTLHGLAGYENPACSILQIILTRRVRIHTLAPLKNQVPIKQYKRRSFIFKTRIFNALQVKTFSADFRIFSERA
jgi:hypothetical protein